MQKSHRLDLNQRPTHYECVALPTELRWRINKLQPLKVQPQILELHQAE